MTVKATIFTLEGLIDGPELLDQLREAVEELERKMKAAVPIKRGGQRVGYGVSKAKRGIAADAVISIARAIKSLRGW